MVMKMLIGIGCLSILLIILKIIGNVHMTWFLAFSPALFVSVIYVMVNLINTIIEVITGEKDAI